MGILLPRTTYDCRCPTCNTYIGAWWHFDLASQPIFKNVPCYKDRDGYPYCTKCRMEISWFALKKKARR